MPLICLHDRFLVFRLSIVWRIIRISDDVSHVIDAFDNDLPDARTFPDHQVRSTAIPPEACRLAGAAKMPTCSRSRHISDLSYARVRVCFPHSDVSYLCCSFQ